MCHICAILNGIAGIIVFSAPSAVSATWFPPEERTTATGIALVLNNLGNAVSFLAAPAIVPDPPSSSPNDDFGGLADPSLRAPSPWNSFGASNDSNSSCPHIDPDVKHMINNRLDKLMYLGNMR